MLISRRDDTMGRDELTSRVKWRWRPSEDTTVDLTWLHADLDNGYDAWSIDNSRHSLADRPGKDAQQSDGASLRVDTSAGTLGRLTVTAALSDSDSEYSFDSDWGNAESWAPFTYDYFDRQLRDRRGRSLEARITSEEAASHARTDVGRGRLRTGGGRAARCHIHRCLRRSFHTGIFRHDGQASASATTKPQNVAMYAPGRSAVQRTLGLVIRFARRAAQCGLQRSPQRQRRVERHRRVRTRYACGAGRPHCISISATICVGSQLCRVATRPAASTSARPRRCCRSSCLNIWSASTSA